MMAILEQETRKKLENGDLVTLNSGGPIMTVADNVVCGNDSVWCCWFVGSEMSREKFNVESLTKK